MLLVGIAAAADLLVWSYNTFPEGQELDGYDGWEAGYREDPWQGYNVMGSHAVAQTDDGAGSEHYGEGGALDNWLVHEAGPVWNGSLSTVVIGTDDDAWGVVVDETDGDWLMVLFCGASGATDALCPDLDSAYAASPYWGIFQVEDGRATLLASQADGYPIYVEMRVRITLADGVLTATNDALGASVSADVPEGTHFGRVGFYAFQNGLAGGYATGFGEVELTALDSDADGIADDDEVEEPVDTGDTGDTATPADTGDSGQEDDTGRPGRKQPKVVVDGADGCGLVGESWRPRAAGALVLAGLLRGRRRTIS